MSQSHMSQNHKIEKNNEIKGTVPPISDTQLA